MWSTKRRGSEISATPPTQTLTPTRAQTPTQTGASGSEAGAGADPPPPPLAGSPTPVRRTRLGGLWAVAVLGAIVLVLLLVFILQNGQRVQVHIFGAHWNAPLGVALLMAAALGVLLVVIPGGGRIIQLRRAARRTHREREILAGRLDAVTAAAEPAAAAPRSGVPVGTNPETPETPPAADSAEPETFDKY